MIDDANIDKPPRPVFGSIGLTDRMSEGVGAKRSAPSQRCRSLLDWWDESDVEPHFAEAVN